MTTNESILEEVRTALRHLRAVRPEELTTGSTSRILVAEHTLEWLELSLMRNIQTLAKEKSNK